MITGLNLTLPGWADLGRPAATLLLRAVTALRRWHRRRRDLRHVMQLDDYLLRDVGLSRDWLLRESVRPFWHR